MQIKRIKKKKEVLTNDFKFTRDKGATFLVKSKKMPIGFWINPKKWSFERSNSNEASEFSFTLKDADLYAMAITERIEIPLANLKKIAVSNAREVAPDVSVDKEEYRWVNGKKILMMQLSGTTEGVKFVYYAYYYSSKKGVVQLVTYSSSSLFEEYKKEMELFLNGFVETE